MNKEEIIKALDSLIEDFNDYSTDYTKTACIYYKEIFIEIKNQLEEKDKVIDEAIEYINQQIFDMTMTGNGTLSLDRLLEILERGKNDN